MSAPTLGFVGFGEAARHLAQGLATEGVRDITAFDLAPRPCAGVSFCDTANDAIQDRNIVISAVTAGVAVRVANDIAAHVQAGQIVIDINSVAPDTKKEIADLINGTGARFVEASVMGAVPTFGHKVPILLCGEAAGDVIDALAPFGMDLTDLGPDYGRAAATKMFRSIMIKGLEALLQECVRGADKYGAADDVLKSVGEGYPGVDWGQLASYLIGRTAVHGARRADEMDEVAKTLSSLGIEPLMAEAAAARIRSLASPELKAQFGDTPPESFHDVLAAMKGN